MSDRRRLPTRTDHLRFCSTEGWTEIPCSHHATYELALPDTTILRTRMSRPVDRTVYDIRIFTHILRDQLDVNAEEFWACVDDGVLPDRGFAQQETPKETLPADIVFQLVYRARVPEQEVAAMTRDEAMARIQRFWAEGK